MKHVSSVKVDGEAIEIVGILSKWGVDSMYNNPCLVESHIGIFTMTVGLLCDW